MHYVLVGKFPSQTQLEVILLLSRKISIVRLCCSYSPGAFVVVVVISVVVVVVVDVVVVNVVVVVVVVDVVVVVVTVVDVDVIIVEVVVGVVDDVVVVVHCDVSAPSFVGFLLTDSSATMITPIEMAASTLVNTSKKHAHGEHEQ